MVGLNDIIRILEPIRNQISSLLGRGEVRRVNNTGTVSKGSISLAPSSKQPQRLQIQVMADEILSDIERAQPYGLETYPKPDMSALVAFFGGDRSHGCVICVQDFDNRPTDLTEGEVCLYNADGTRVKLGSKVQIKNSTYKAEVLFEELFDAIDGIGTYGSPGSHTLNAASKAEFTALKTKFLELFGDT